MTRSSAAPILLTTIGILVVSILAAGPVWSEEAKSTPPPLEDDTQAGAALTCAEQIASRVQARYDTVRNIRSRFTQVTRSVMLGNISLGDDAPATGRVQIAKPGKMRWAYETPRASLVVSNGEVVWIYDPEAGEAQRLPVLEGYLTGAALEFLLGNGNLLEQFAIRSQTCNPDANGTIELDLVPRKAANYERLGMRVEVATGQLVATSLQDIFGNRTLISFSEIEVNVEMSDADFVFEVPEGVLVVDVSPGQP